MNVDYSDKRVLFVCRGYPGLGRVTPSVSLFYRMQMMGLKNYTFISYLVGYNYLKEIGINCININAPVGNFIEPISSSFEKTLNVIESFQPDLIILDGEPYFLIFLRKLEYKVFYLANVYDIIGQENHFRRMTRILFSFANFVFAPSLSWKKYSKISVAKNFMITPPLVKYLSNTSLSIPAVKRPFVIVCLGGGISKAGKVFSQLTHFILKKIIKVVNRLCEESVIGQAWIILSDPALSKPNLKNHPAVTIVSHPIELVLVLPEADLIISRAGRNIIAELLYYKKRGIIIPLTADPIRGSEQLANADFVKAYPTIDVVTTNVLRNGGLEIIIRAALLSQDNTEFNNYSFELGNETIINAIDKIIV